MDDAGVRARRRPVKCSRRLISAKRNQLRKIEGTRAGRGWPIAAACQDTGVFGSRSVERKQTAETRILADSRISFRLLPVVGVNLWMPFRLNMPVLPAATGADCLAASRRVVIIVTTGIFDLARSFREVRGVRPPRGGRRHSLRRDFLAAVMPARFFQFHKSLVAVRSLPGGGRQRGWRA
jgi:hypothetical protein